MGDAITNRLRATAAQGAEFQRPLQPGEDGAARHARARAQAWSAWPQLLVFPEATTTSNDALITFATGAFRAGVPVQPCVVSFTNWDGFDMSWSMNGSYAEIVLRMFCRPRGVTCTIHYLPVYYPSEAERSDARLFATNVRDAMRAAQTKLAEAGEVQRAELRARRLRSPLPRRALERHLDARPPPSGALRIFPDCSYRDVALATQAVRLELSDVYRYVVGIEGVKARWGSAIDTRYLGKHLRAFAALDRTQRGRIAPEDLAQGLDEKLQPDGARRAAWLPAQWSFAALSASFGGSGAAPSAAAAETAQLVAEAGRSYARRCVELMEMDASASAHVNAERRKGSASFKQYLERFALPLSLSLDGTTARGSEAGASANALPTHPASVGAVALLFEVCDVDGRGHIDRAEFVRLVRFVASAAPAVVAPLSGSSGSGGGGSGGSGDHSRSVGDNDVALASEALLRSFGEEGGHRIGRDGWRRFAAAHPGYMHALSAALLPAAPPAPAKSNKMWR